MSTKQTPNERTAQQAAQAAKAPAKRGTRKPQAPKPAPAAQATQVSPTAAAAPKPKPKQPCCCGCGALVVGLYRQGHDARHKGHLLDVATGQTPKHAPATPAELKQRGYTAERLAERGTVVATLTTPEQARATVARLAWSAFLDAREAKLAAAAERKAAAAERRAAAKLAKQA